MGHHSGSFHTAIGSKQGDQNEAESRRGESARLDPSGEPPAGRRGGTSDELAKQRQRSPPGKEPGQSNPAGARVRELGDLLAQRVVRGLQQWLDRNCEKKEAEATGGSGNSPMPEH
jgi:hypothetical protein